MSETARVPRLVTLAGLVSQADTPHKTSVRCEKLPMFMSNQACIRFTCTSRILCLVCRLGHVSMAGASVAALFRPCPRMPTPPTPQLGLRLVRGCKELTQATASFQILCAPSPAALQLPAATHAAVCAQEIYPPPELVPVCRYSVRAGTAPLPRVGAL